FIGIITTLIVISLIFLIIYSFSFFFQAEDGIRDRNVTGVQTCALPISGGLLLSKIYEEAGRPAPRSSAPSTTRGRSAWRPTASPPRTASSTRSSTGYGNVRNSYAHVPPRRQTHRSARTSTTNSAKGHGTR